MGVSPAICQVEASGTAARALGAAPPSQSPPEAGLRFRLSRGEQTQRLCVTIARLHAGVGGGGQVEGHVPHQHIDLNTVFQSVLRVLRRLPVRFYHNFWWARCPPTTSWWVQPPSALLFSRGCKGPAAFPPCGRNLFRTSLPGLHQTEQSADVFIQKPNATCTVCIICQLHFGNI